MVFKQCSGGGVIKLWNQDFLRRYERVYEMWYTVAIKKLLGLIVVFWPQKCENHRAENTRLLSYLQHFCGCWQVFEGRLKRSKHLTVLSNKLFYELPWNANKVCHLCLRLSKYIKMIRLYKERVLPIIFVNLFHVLCLFQLFREVRIMKILNHPNIGTFLFLVIFKSGEMLPLFSTIKNVMW